MGSLGKILLVVAAVLVVAGLTRFFMLASSSRTQGSTVAGDHSLSPCSDRPNCVSSVDTREEHRVDPLNVTGGGDRAIDRARALIEQMPGARVVEVTGDYLHAEFASRIFGFIDDLELKLDPERGVLDVRSASRVGYSDMGVNEKRVEALRRALGD